MLAYFGIEIHTSGLHFLGLFHGIFLRITLSIFMGIGELCSIDVGMVFAFWFVVSFCVVFVSFNFFVVQFFHSNKIFFFYLIKKKELVHAGFIFDLLFVCPNDWSGRLLLVLYAKEIGISYLIALVTLWMHFLVWEFITNQLDKATK